jgi:cytochrome P450
LEFEILFSKMLEVLPRLEVTTAPRWKPRFVLRGLEAIPVRVGG